MRTANRYEQLAARLTLNLGPGIAWNRDGQEAQRTHFLAPRIHLYSKTVTMATRANADREWAI